MTAPLWLTFASPFHPAGRRHPSPSRCWPGCVPPARAWRYKEDKKHADRREVREANQVERRSDRQAQTDMIRSKYGTKSWGRAGAPDEGARSFAPALRSNALAVVATLPPAATQVSSTTPGLWRSVARCTLGIMGGDWRSNYSPGGSEGLTSRVARVPFSRGLVVLAAHGRCSTYAVRGPRISCRHPMGKPRRRLRLGCAEIHASGALSAFHRPI